MLNEKIGGQASSLNNRVLFYRNILVDAVFDKLSVMSAAELRELAGVLPGPAEMHAICRRCLRTCRNVSEEHSEIYPGSGHARSRWIAFAYSDGGFQIRRGSGHGRYQAKAGDSTLMLIEYPTPQIAAEKLRQIDASHQPVAQQPAGSPSIVDVAPFLTNARGRSLRSRRSAGNERSKFPAERSATKRTSPGMRTPTSRRKTIWRTCSST